jgi:hypothetical protein
MIKPEMGINHPLLLFHEKVTEHTKKVVSLFFKLHHSHKGPTLLLLQSDSNWMFLFSMKKRGLKPLFLLIFSSLH